MPQQPILEVLGAKRFPEQRVITQVDHSGAKIVAGAPVRINLPEFIRAEGLFGRGRLSFETGSRWHKSSRDLDGRTRNSDCVIL